LVGVGAPLEFGPLTCEYQTNPIGIDAVQPRLGWVLVSDERGQAQTAYRIMVASSPEALSQDKPDVWDSREVPMARSILTPYQGPPLQSGQRYWWKVKVWDRDGQPSAWSAPAWWEMGLLAPADWAPAYWVQLPKDTRNSPLAARELKTSEMEEAVKVESHPSPLFRRELVLTGEVSRARAYVGCQGYCELRVNGQKVGDAVLEPAPSPTIARAYYATHDIRKYLRRGTNAVGLMLGNGFFGQNLAFNAPFLEHGQPAAIAKIVVEYAGGGQVVVVTDSSWRTETGPVLFDNVYAGETYDARNWPEGWDSPGFDDSRWTKALVVTNFALDKPAVEPAAKPAKSGPPGSANLKPDITPFLPELAAQPLPPIRRVRTLPAVRHFKGKNGREIYDLGRNIVGWARLKVHGEKAGTVITMRFAEALTPDGSAIDTASTGAASTGFVPTDIYICSGTAQETWEPRFTCHGFRYVEVDGDSQPGDDTIEGVLVRSDVERAGDFVCSMPVLNRIYEASVRTVENNLQGIPVDSPNGSQMASMGGAMAVAPATIFNFDVLPLWAKFMDDLSAKAESARTRSGQLGGSLPLPRYVNSARWLGGAEAWPDWGAAVALVPWYMYIYYGDTNALVEHYDLMRGWMESLKNQASGYILEKGHGEWGLADELPAGAPPALVSTAHYYGALRLMEQVARLVWKMEDAFVFAEQSRRVQAAFHRRFYDPGSKSYGSATANALVLRFGLAPPEIEAAVARRLAEQVTDVQGGYPPTGILATRPLLTLLDKFGYEAVVFKAMTLSGYPALDWILSQGQTTWPETITRTAGGGLNCDRPLDYAPRAAIAAWFHESVGGIRPVADAPGFRRFELSPHHWQILSHASAVYRSPYGLIKSAWKVESGRLRWRVDVPVNATATVYIPAARASRVKESGMKLEKSPGVRILGLKDGRVVCEIVSGSYLFETELK